jgi:hypothetical protein
VRSLFPPDELLVDLHERAERLARRLHQRGPERLAPDGWVIGPARKGVASAMAAASPVRDAPCFYIRMLRRFNGFLASL